MKKAVFLRGTGSLADRALVFPLFFPLFFLPGLAFADRAPFPVQEITAQAFNFSVFAIAFIFLIRKPVQLFFHKRRDEFLSFERQAMQLEKERKGELKAWEKKLKGLREREKDIDQKARSEGEKFMSQKRREIQNLRDRLKREAEFFLRLEREKAKKELMGRWREKIIQAAGRSLKNQAPARSFQQALFKDFFKQLESHL